MSSRFICDHCMPREIADALQQFGCGVELLRDHRPTPAPDADVIAKAQDFEGLLVSLNGDFTDIVAIQLHDHQETIPTLIAG